MADQTIIGHYNTRMQSSHRVTLAFPLVLTASVIIAVMMYLCLAVKNGKGREKEGFLSAIEDGNTPLTDFQQQHQDSDMGFQQEQNAFGENTHQEGNLHFLNKTGKRMACDLMDHHVRRSAPECGLRMPEITVQRSSLKEACVGDTCMSNDQFAVIKRLVKGNYLENKIRNEIERTKQQMSEKKVSLDSEISTIESRIKSLKDSSVEKDEFQHLKTRYDEFKGTLQERIDALEQDVEANESRVESIRQKAEESYLNISGGKVSRRTVGGTDYVYHTFTVPGEHVLHVLRGTSVDVFLVGGGGGTSRNRGWGGAGGGGGGYVRSYFGVRLSNSSDAVVKVGDGGKGNNDGETSEVRSSADGVSLVAYGGEKNNGQHGGDGGSGGGGSTGMDSRGNRTGEGTGGSDGSDGVDARSAGKAGRGGNGQGYSTREFNQRLSGGTWVTIDSSSDAKLYSGGGSGGGLNSSVWGSRGYMPGGKGGGGAAVPASWNSPYQRSAEKRKGKDGLGGGAGGEQAASGEGAKGGSGIVIVRYTVSSF